MSSVRSIGGGLMVVTKIVPIEGEGEVPMGDVTSAEFRRPTPRLVAVPNAEKVPESARVFQKSHPMPLGVVQIFLGLMTAAVGVLTLIQPVIFGEIPLGLGIFFIISGSVTAAAHKGQNMNMIKGALAVNIVSCLLALPAVGYICLELSKQIYDECLERDRDRYDYGNNYWECFRAVRQYKSAVNGLKGLLLVMAVFQFCVSTTVSVFAAKAIRRQADNHQVGCLTGPSGGADDAPLLTP
ncbi:membrane-spanning 4-domains subfamily A member 4A [Engraulis encrasicolus]|uniref:membrane-spanning 4-domains subfamily A member 4A n=1 Tax=Engraulis encrasicolus TaxID=184585 RepID=UPI002FD1DE2B